MPISASQTQTFDGRLTFSIGRWMKRNLRDLMLGHNPAFIMMKEKGNVIEGGLGVQIIEPLMVFAEGGPQADGILDPYANLEHLEQVGLTSAYYTPAEYGMPISVPKYEMKLQGSETKKVDYVQGVMKKSLKDFFIKQNAHIWAAEGAAGSNGSARNRLGSFRTYFNRSTGNAVTGDQTLSEQDGTAIGSSPLTSVGGIDRVTNNNAFWSTPCVTATTALSLTVVNNAISLATRGTDVPDLVWIGRKGFDQLVATLQGAGQTNLWDVPDVMKKFSTLRYRGCFFCFDDSVPAGTSGGTNVQMFVINTEYIKLVCDSMEPEVDKKDDPKRLLETWLASWYGQLTSGHLGRVHSRYSDVSLA